MGIPLTYVRVKLRQDDVSWTGEAWLEKAVHCVGDLVDVWEFADKAIDEGLATNGLDGLWEYAFLCEAYFAEGGYAGYIAKQFKKHLKEKGVPVFFWTKQTVTTKKTHEGHEGSHLNGKL